MSKKRVADNYITDQNWDRDEEDDDEDNKPEPFKAASEEVLSKRTFKKAARRVNPADKEKLANPFGAFGGFGGGGFGAKPPSFPTKAANATFDSKPTGFNLSFSNSKPSTFTPLSASVSATQPSTAPFTFTPIAKGENTEEKSTEVSIKPDTSIIATMDTESAANDGNIPTKDVAGNVGGAEDDKYVTKLASLNKCLLTWIDQHMEDNNCIDLTPVFRDYEKHLNEISV